VKKEEAPAGRGRGSTAFLLAQIGAHAAEQFAERIAPLGIGPAHAGMLRAIAASGGTSQRALAEVLEIQPSRLVQLVDDAEQKGLLERRDSPDDRRVYQLFLSDAGREMLEAIGRAGRAHEQSITGALDAEERAVLRELLTKIADHQGLTPGVHPGFRRRKA
jgi:DNA-binding MarR family transcriptional regulator